MDVKDFIKLVEEIKQPAQERLEETHGVMADGYVMACDDILEKLKDLRP